MDYQFLCEPFILDSSNLSRLSCDLLTNRSGAESDKLMYVCVATVRTQLGVSDMGATGRKM
jgi:hypothetical protein